MEKSISSRLYGRITLPIRMLAGKLFNFAGLPGTVRDCHFTSSSGVSIDVRVDAFYTQVSAGGFVISFDRITGKVKNTFNDYKWGKVQRSNFASTLPDPLSQRIVETQNEKGCKQPSGRPDSIILNGGPERNCSEIVGTLDSPQSILFVNDDLEDKKLGRITKHIHLNTSFSSSTTVVIESIGLAVS